MLKFDSLERFAGSRVSGVRLGRIDSTGRKTALATMSLPGGRKARRAGGGGMRGRWLLLLTLAAWGWGATGHEWATGIAIEKLPDGIPAFVRDPAVLADMALMGRELDRSKGAGETHDKERDPGHNIDLTDDGKVMGILLPVTRACPTPQPTAGSTMPCLREYEI